MMKDESRIVHACVYVKNIGIDNLSSERLKAKTNKIHTDFLTGC